MIISEDKMLSLLKSLQELTPSNSRWEWKVVNNNTLTLCVMSSNELKDTYSGDIDVMAVGETWTPCIHLSSDGSKRTLSPYQVVDETFKSLLDKYNRLPYIYVGSVRKEIKIVRQLVEYPKFSENPNHEIRDNQSYRILFDQLVVINDDDTEELEFEKKFNILNALLIRPGSEEQKRIIEELPVISLTENSISNGRVVLKTKKNGCYFTAPGSYQNDNGILTIFENKSNLPARLKTALLNQSITIPKGDEPLVV